VTVARPVHCLSCGARVSRYAARCPRCGAAQAHKRLGSSVGLAVMLALLLGGLLWWGLIGGGR